MPLIPRVSRAAYVAVFLVTIAATPSNARPRDTVAARPQTSDPAPASSALAPPASPASGAAPAPRASVTQPTTTAMPAPHASVSRVHLHRPGTDVEGDVLTGNVGSDIYVIRGDVTLHSDPKIDRAVAAESESEDPLTVTADEIDIDKLGLDYVAKGHVHFTQGLRSGHADLATLDEDAHTLDLIGNADVREGERRAVAAKMHYNTRDKGFLGSGDVRIYEPLPAPGPKASGSPAPKKHRRRLPI